MKNTPPPSESLLEKFRNALDAHPVITRAAVVGLLATSVCVINLTSENDTTHNASHASKIQDLPPLHIPNITAAEREFAEREAKKSDADKRIEADDFEKMENAYKKIMKTPCTLKPK